MPERKKIVYCTYFDKAFILKGLALHNSLMTHNPDSKLWILAFDSYTERVLRRMKLKGVTVVSLKDFEDKALLTVKPTRHNVEYYWTCTPSWILYVMRKSRADFVTYLDADLLFYSNPDSGVLEIGKKSILAVEHRFPKGRESMAAGSGRFNVAFNVFKNDAEGKKCLERWRQQCLDWCYWRSEDGKLGDQMYLDEWPRLYRKSLLISKNIGVDVAPWNVSQYSVKSKNGRVYVDSAPLICYHFHTFRILSPNHFGRVMGYTLSRGAVENIYKPYEDELRRQYLFVKKIDKKFSVSPTDKDKKMLHKQGFLMHLSPVYWRVRNILEWLRS